AAHRAGPVGQTGCWPSRNASLRVLGRSRRALRDGPLICGTDTTCLVPTGSRAAGYLHHSVGLTPVPGQARRRGAQTATANDATQPPRSLSPPGRVRKGVALPRSPAPTLLAGAALPLRATNRRGALPPVRPIP